MLNVRMDTFEEMAKDWTVVKTECIEFVETKMLEHLSL